MPLSREHAPSCRCRCARFRARAAVSAQLRCAMSHPPGLRTLAAPLPSLPRGLRALILGSVHAQRTARPLTSSMTSMGIIRWLDVADERCLVVAFEQATGNPRRLPGLQSRG